MFYLMQFFRKFRFLTISVDAWIFAIINFSVFRKKCKGKVWILEYL